MKRDRRFGTHKTSIMWARSNYGFVQAVHHSRKDAKMACERATGMLWSQCKSYMEVTKVRLVPVKS